MRLQDGEQLYTPQDVNGDGDTHGQYVTPGAVMKPDEFEVRGCDSDFYAGSKEKQNNHAVEVVNELLSRYEDIDKVRERQQLTEQMDIAESEADVRTFGNGDDEQVKGDDEQETNSDVTVFNVRPFGLSIVVRAPDNTLQIEPRMDFRPEGSPGPRERSVTPPLYHIKMAGIEADSDPESPERTSNGFQSQQIALPGDTQHVCSPEGSPQPSYITCIYDVRAVRNVEKDAVILDDDAVDDTTMGQFDRNENESDIEVEKEEAKEEDSRLIMRQCTYEYPVATLSPSDLCDVTHKHSEPPEISPAEIEFSDDVTVNDDAYDDDDDDDDVLRLGSRYNPPMNYVEEDGGPPHCDFADQQ